MSRIIWAWLALAIAGSASAQQHDHTAHQPAAAAPPKSTPATGLPGYRPSQSESESTPDQAWVKANAAVTNTGPAHVHGAAGHMGKQDVAPAKPAPKAPAPKKESHHGH